MNLRSVALMITVLVLVKGEETNKTPKGKTAAPPVKPSPKTPPDTSPCPQQVNDAKKGPKLPELDKKFIVNVQCSILNKNKTIEITEFYDGKSNRGAIAQMVNGTKQMYIYNFNSYESYLIKNNKCEVTNLQKSDKRFDFFNFTLGDKGGHISKINDIFDFGKQYNETYIGPTTIRGIPVNHWKSCIQWNGKYNTVFNLDWYFTLQNYTSAVGTRAIPIRAELKGSALDKIGSSSKHDFHHIYEFTRYIPEPLLCEYEIQSLTQIPRGIVCDRAEEGKEWPGLQDQFQMAIEVLHPEEKQLASMRRYYDFRNQLSRLDLQPDDELSKSYVKKYSHTPLTVIHDYNMGIEYVIEKETGKCHMGLIPNDADDAHHGDHGKSGHPKSLDPDHPDHLHMAHGKQLMSLDTLTFKYQGQRRVRDIDCDVWASTKDGWPRDGCQSTVEMYYAQEGWQNQGGKLTVGSPPLIGMWIKTTNSSDSAPHEPHVYIQHVYEFSQNAEMLGIFDPTTCFNQTTQMKHVTFRLKVSYGRSVHLNKHVYEPAVRSAVSQAANISASRITQLDFYASNPELTNVRCSILALAKDAGPLNPEATLDKAYELLKKAIDDGLTVKVKFNKYDKNVDVSKGSLSTAKDMYDPRKLKKICVTKTGYTSGSMAGLAFAMLFIGIIAGFVIAWVFWRRKRGIPYSVHH